MENVFRITDSQTESKIDSSASKNVMKEVTDTRLASHSNSPSDRAKELIAIKSDMGKFTNALRQSQALPMDQSQEDKTKNSPEQERLDQKNKIESEELIDYKRDKALESFNGVFQVGINAAEFLTDSFVTAHNSINKVLTGKDSVALKHLANLDVEADDARRDKRNEVYDHLTKRELEFSMESLGYNNINTQRLIDRVRVLDVQDQVKSQATTRSPKLSSKHTSNISKPGNEIKNTSDFKYRTSSIGYFGSLNKSTPTGLKYARAK